jgi:hypothetical protein
MCYLHTTQAVLKWKMRKQTMMAVEGKGAALGTGETGWVKPNMRLFTKTYRMKAVDWLNLSRGAGLHIFNDTMGEGLSAEDAELQREAFESILLLFNMCCTVTCNVDGKPPTLEETNR